MVIVCQKCHSQFFLDESQVEEKEFLVRCTKCDLIFTAYKPVRVRDITFRDLNEAKKSHLARVIAISNQKGGVAKTSTCLNLGVALSEMKRKVLLVDFDVQANLTISLGIQNKPSFYEAVHSLKSKLMDYVVQTVYPKLYLLPSSKTMIFLDKKYFGAMDFEYLLKDRLMELHAQFDYILIDTPPSIGFFTLNALTASHLVVVPAQCDYLSTHGVDQILKLIQLIQAQGNERIQFRILITMFDEKSTASKLIFSKLINMYRGKTFDTFIGMDVKMKEAQIMHLPVFHYDKNSSSAVQYNDLAAEILKGENV